VGTTQIDFTLMCLYTNITHILGLEVLPLVIKYLGSSSRKLQSRAIGFMVLYIHIFTSLYVCIMYIVFYRVRDNIIDRERDYIYYICGDRNMYIERVIRESRLNIPITNYSIICPPTLATYIL
jgi:hypothetical protein